MLARLPARSTRSSRTDAGMIESARRRRGFYTTGLPRRGPGVADRPPNAEPADAYACRGRTTLVHVRDLGGTSTAGIAPLPIVDSVASRDCPWAAMERSRWPWRIPKSFQQPRVIPVSSPP